MSPSNVVLYARTSSSPYPCQACRRLSDFLSKDQYEEAMQQFKILCETQLGYVWRVAQHADKASPELPGVCYLHFNDVSGQWERSFV